MICAGWIRFRASLMAIRRTSWIDQRINDGVAMLWLLPWFGGWFFWAARKRSMVETTVNRRGNSSFVN